MSKKIFAIVVTLALVLSVAVPGYADISALSAKDLSVVEIDSLKVITVDDEIGESAAKEPFNISADYADNGNAVVTFAANEYVIQNDPEIKFTVTLPDSKTSAYEALITSDSEYEDIDIENVLLNTEYHVYAVIEDADDVTSYVGWFTVLEKGDSLSPVCKFTKEVYKTAAYVKESVKALENSTILTPLTKNVGTVGNIALAAATRTEVESNNTMSLADTTYDDDTMYGRISPSGDIDYYKVQFAQAGKANFWLGDIPSGKDYDFYLYNASGTLLASSTSTSDQEQIYDYTVTANTWYYMRVVGYNGANDANNYYRVRAKNYPTVVAGDSYEPNNTMSAASSISNNANITSANIHTTSDVDYYKFSLASVSDVTISLSNIPSGCDYDLKLYNSSNVQKGSSTNGGNTSESISIDSLAAGTYYINIFSYSGSSSSKYTLSLTSTVVSSSSGDQYESNDTQSTAKTISSGNITASLHNTSDVDWYKFTTTSANRAITVTLTPLVTANLPSGELKVQIINSSGRIVNNLVSTNTQKRNVGYAAVDTGTYYIKVSNNTNSNGRDYTLKLDISDPSVEIIIPTIGQENTNWCWAACAEMVGEDYWGKLNNFTTPARNVTQSQIVQAVHGNTNNTRAILVETGQALNFVLENNINSGASVGMSMVYTQAGIFDRIWSEKQAIIISCFNNLSGNGHSVVIKGIYIYGSETDVLIADPWAGGDDVEVNLDAVYNTGYRPSDTRAWGWTVRIDRTI